MPSEWSVDGLMAARRPPARWDGVDGRHHAINANWCEGVLSPYRLSDLSPFPVKPNKMDAISDCPDRLPALSRTQFPCVR